MQCRVDDFLLPGYDVEELVGFGGSGEVWRAREVASGEVVALKRLRAGLSADAAAREVSEQRLSREAALLATIRHDHIVALRSVVPTDDGLVLVLDYAEGGSLAALLAARGRLSAGEVVTIGAPLAQALGDVHARGLVHGDVTPANVLFDGSGKPLLADLGVASLAGDRAGPAGRHARIRRPGARFGFRLSMRDVVSVAGAGPASDVHGLAAVCFSALAGVPPYVEGSAVAQPLRPLAPGTPATLGRGDRSGPRPRPCLAARRERVRASVVRGVRTGRGAARPHHRAGREPADARPRRRGSGCGLVPTESSLPHVNAAPAGRHRWSPRRAGRGPASGHGGVRGDPARCRRRGWGRLRGPATVIEHRQAPTANPAASTAPRAPPAPTSASTPESASSSRRRPESGGRARRRIGPPSSRRSTLRAMPRSPTHAPTNSMRCTSRDLPR